MAEAFIATGLRLLADGRADHMAMLLPCDFDSAKTRARLFDENRLFSGKVVLRRRIKWFDSPNLPAQPKENSAWFWFSRSGRRSSGHPVILYAPRNDSAGRHERRGDAS